MKDIYYSRVDLFWCSLCSTQFNLVLFKMYFSKWNPLIVFAIEIDTKEKRIEIIFLGFRVAFLFKGGMENNKHPGGINSISLKAKTECKIEYFSFKNRKKWLSEN